MWNVLTGIGAVVILGGVTLAISSVLGGLRRIGRWWRSRKLPDGPSRWAMAVPSGQAYVPGSIRSRFLLALLGLVIVGLGLPIGWAGWSLADFASARSPTRLGELWVEGGGRLLVVKVRGGENEGYNRPGKLIVAHAEYLRFPSWLEQAGLGPYFRWTHIAGYDTTLQVLEQRGRARVDLQPTHELFARLEWLVQQWPGIGIVVRRRAGESLGESSTRAELWTVADADGGRLEWRN